MLIMGYGIDDYILAMFRISEGLWSFATGQMPRSGDARIYGPREEMTCLAGVCPL